MIYIIFALLIVIVVQQVYFLRQIQVLVNKIMSGSYQSYASVESPTPRKIQIDDLPNDDLSVFADFS